MNDSEWFEIVWGDAVYQASKETGFENFPETCPWLIGDILSDLWLPTG
ncbi:MAG: DUF29 family protein [Methylovulum sp.]|nr:DUF29 family protein [Methylovulum sp.]